MAKYYSFETMFRSLKDELSIFLKQNKIAYELSGCGSGWHFEILLTPVGVQTVNNWLDDHTITEK